MKTTYTPCGTRWLVFAMALLIALAGPSFAVAQNANAASAEQMLEATNGADTNRPAGVAMPVTSPQPPVPVRFGSGEWSGQRQIVSIGRDVELKAGEVTDAIVVVGGSAKVYGRVREAVVAIGGDVEMGGQARGAVAVLGSVHLLPTAVVHDDSVAVLGDLKMDSGASVHHDAVSVGGVVDVADGARVGGQKVIVPFMFAFPNVSWIRNWLRYCVFEFRPLAPQVGWVWVVAGVFLLIYLLITIAFPRPVQACVTQLSTRLATTFLVGLLIMFLKPFAYLLLAVTGIGLLVIPFISIGLLIAGLVGKAAWFQYFGTSIGRGVGLEMLQKPVAGLPGGNSPGDLPLHDPCPGIPRVADH